MSTLVGIPLGKPISLQVIILYAALNLGFCIYLWNLIRRRKTKPDGCKAPPLCWECSRERNHPGPCAARYRPPLRERIRVAWQNWRVRKTGRAMRHLSKALQTDPGYRLAWRANLSECVYRTSYPFTDIPNSERMRAADCAADSILKTFFNA